MANLYEGGPAVTVGEWVELKTGLYRLVAEIPDGDEAQVTFDERFGEDGEPHPIQLNDEPLTQVGGGPTHDYTAPATCFLRVNRSGGTASFKVKALLIDIR